MINISPEVRVWSAEGDLGTTIAVRFRRGTDFIEGIKKVCEEYGIEKGFVNSAIGSFEKCSYKILASKDTKLGAGYTEPIEKEGPIELLGAMGNIAEGEDGSVDIHVHATLCDEDGVVQGGHLVEGENPTLATVELNIVEVENIDMPREEDEEIGAGVLYPK